MGTTDRPRAVRTGDERRPSDWRECSGMDVWTVRRVVGFALTPVRVVAAGRVALHAFCARAASSPGGERPVDVAVPAAAAVPPPGPVDPFRTLALQYRLGALARELEDLTVDDGRVHTRGLRLAAVTAAYDDVLADACRLAGLPPQRDGHDHSEVRRMRTETALRSAGWTW